MSVFDFLKPKKEEQEATPQEESNLLLAMPLYNGTDSYNVRAVIEQLQNYWGLEVSDIEGLEGADEDAVTFTLDGEMVAMAKMPVPVPAEEIQSTAEYAYLWETAAADCKDHTSHAIVTLLSGNAPTIERYKLFTMLLASILETSNAIGIYQGEQTLLLPKALYLEYADFLREEDQSPLALWVYIGLVNDGTTCSAYTYGLSGFGKQEIEVVHSEKNIGELYDFITMIALYIIDYDVTLRHGETIGFSEEEKIKITASKGAFLDGETLKIEYN